MKISKKDGTFQVESSRIGKFYEVNLLNKTCTCPHFVHRLRRAGGECKHILAAKEFATGGESDKYDGLVKFVSENVFVDSIELINKFGEETVNSLIDKGELIEEHGKVRLL